ncbi:MAG: hypothetical protein DCC57_06075 [Chloroflexi bacterium]|nr:MAG: hypothetical protein DCC57_06075 [Chloroflexota bacterium]
MAEEPRRIPFEEFADNLSRLFAQVIHNQEALLVEGEDGALVEVKPVAPASPPRRLVPEKTETEAAEDDAAFLSAAGGWADVDIDAFLQDIYAGRRSSRPPVEL